MSSISARASALGPATSEAEQKPTAIFCPTCGAKKPRPRSLEQHNRFFALIEAAYMHWPEAHAFKPKSKEHLRYWLEMMAGHFDVVVTIRADTVNPKKLAAVLSAVMRASDDARMFIDCADDLVTVKRTRSIRHNVLGQAAFNSVNDEVASVLAAEIGINPDRLLAEHKNAA